MSNILALAVVLLVLAACGKQEAPQVHQEQRAEARKEAPPPPPPLPPLPGSNFKPVPEAIALAAAKRMGAGDCSDLQKIQGLPLKGQHGFDPYYDRIVVHIDSYENCLLKATSSTTPTRVVPSYPGAELKSLGDLAFTLLLDGGKVAWGDCTPPEVIEQEKQAGSFAFYAWLRRPGSRGKWHDCLIRKHGT